MFFIGSNTKRFNGLYSEVARQNLQGDALLVKNLIEKNTREEFKELFKETNKRFTLIQKNGEVLFDSERYGEEYEMENHVSRPEVEDALEIGEGFYIRKSASLGKYMAYYAKKYTDKNGIEHILRTSRDFGKDREIVKKIMTYQFIFFLMLNFIIHYSYKNYLKRHLFKKVDDIKKTLELGDQVKESYAKDDIWLVEFWKVVKEWQNENLENLKMLSLEKKRLKRIISSVDQSVILIDESFKMIMRNDALNYLFRSFDKNLYYLEIKHKEIIDIIKQCEEDKLSVKEEVYIEEINKYFIIGVKYLISNKQYVVTIKDVTRSREMLEVQKNFISNISHELKTPLTNIKGYLIALEDAPEDMKDYFLSVAKNNVDKLENVIMDFLNISKFENSKVVNINQVAFNKIKNNIEMTLDSHIRSKNAEIMYSINLLDENEYLRVDEEKITTILKNLIENGIIYNDKKSPKVQLEIMELYDCYKFTVKDNGIGISDTELGNIFERFYRVDKARTSNVAGTGLGLSIVSEIVKTLGGRLEVESTEGKGSKFVFRILK